MADLTPDCTALAQVHLDRARRIIARQRRLISEIRARGDDSALVGGTVSGPRRGADVTHGKAAAGVSRSLDITSSKQRRARAGHLHVGAAHGGSYFGLS
jgi:hypothetical protein